MSGSNHIEFHVVDYAVFVFALMASLGIGIFHATYRKADTTGSYLMANRKLKAMPTAISILISFLSAVSILGNAAETYFYGVNYFFTVIAYSSAALIVAYVFVPLLYPLQLTSVNEYVLLRYGSRSVVYLAVLLHIATYLANSGPILLGPAIAIQSMMGIDVWVTVIALGMLATVCTSIGGLRAVIWSDVFQTVIIFAGLVIVAFLGIIKVGVISDIWTSLADYDRLSIGFSPIARSSAPGFTIGIAMQMLVMFGCTQIGVQRFSAQTSLQAAKRSLLLTIPVIMVMLTLTGLSGVIAFTYFIKTGCDPYRGGIIHDKNQILPHFVIEVLAYPAVPGAFVACIFCGALSNLSSLYNSSAAMVWQDVLRSRFTHFTEQKRTMVTKILSFVVGILSIGVALMCSSLGGTLMQLAFSLTGIFAAPTASLIISGALSVRPNALSATLGALLSVSFTAWLSIGNVLSDNVNAIKPTLTTNCTYMDHAIFTSANITEPSSKNDVALFYQIPFFWHLTCGLIVGVSSTLLLSFIPGLRREQEDVNPMLLFPFMRRSLKEHKDESLMLKPNGESRGLCEEKEVVNGTDTCNEITENGIQDVASYSCSKMS